ncbi:MAG: glycosyltransferase family 2 protein [Lachnospiraceae bacterium]|nr:glycosyltransferase family 2 protein [Lachnospiraceae bacterium]
MKEPKVSVIIPVYNGSLYIKRVLDSLKKQRFVEMEIILVNDGSTDDSVQVIQDSIEEFIEIGIILVLINKQNEGIAVARNTGLSVANGKYILFIDQDDWVDEDYIQTLYTVAETEDVDMVIGGFKKIDNHGRILEEWKLDCLSPYSKYRITAPWGRIFRKAVLEQHNIMFMNTKISEDFYFNLIFMSNTPNIKVIDYVGYNWFYSEKSESHTNWSIMSTERDPVAVLERLQCDMGKAGGLTKDELTYHFTKYIVWYLWYSMKGASRELADRMYERVFQWMDSYYPDYKKWSVYGGKNEYREKFSVRISVLFSIFAKKIGILKILLKIYRVLR